MRIFPLVLIAVGVFGVLKHFGLIDPAFLQLLWPLVLIGIGAAMLARGPRWRADMRDRMQDRWERRMNRRFGPGWANLSEEERERFRAGMRQWQSHFDDDRGGNSSAPTSASDGSPSKSSARPSAPGEQR
jgi:Domain of unknown function (DUF5668)